MLSDAPPMSELCLMLRNPEFTVMGLLPSLSRSASSLYMQRRAFSLAVAALTLPPLKFPATRSVNSLQLKCRVEPSDDSSALSLAWVEAATTPSAVTPYADWKRGTAARGPGPNSASTAPRGGRPPPGAAGG